MNDHVRKIVKECVESNDEWPAYIEELIHRDGAHKLRILLENGIDIDIIKKSAAIYFHPDEIDGIIKKIQNEIRESKINSTEEVPICTREKALQLALRKINQGCCLQYVSDGLREWLGIDITPEDLDAELSTQPDLLPPNQRLRNAWYNIRHVEPDNMARFQIQQKYGFDWKYQDLIFESDSDNKELQNRGDTHE